MLCGSLDASRERKPLAGMPDKAAPAFKRAIAAPRPPLRAGVLGGDTATRLLTHKDFRKAMRSLSSFHERAGRG